MSKEFALGTQALIKAVDMMVNQNPIFTNEKAGFMIAVTLPDGDTGEHRIVAMLSQPAHPEMVEGMINKFFKRSSYGVFPVEGS